MGRLVQLAYESVNTQGHSSSENWLTLESAKFTLDKQGMELLRSSLGHPLNYFQSTVRCVVSGVQGLDAGSSNERFVVASRLWAEGM